MPKYFADEKTIPFETDVIMAIGIDEPSLQAIFDTKSSVSLRILPAGLSLSSLGCLANILKDGSNFKLINIAGEIEIQVQGFSDLCTVLKHISGTEYNENVQQLFQRNRNNIGASGSINFMS